MYKYLIKLSISIILTLTFVGCDDTGSGLPRKRKGPGLQTAFPDKGTKIAFIFPAGAGAMRVILGITEKLEADLGIKGLGEVINVAGGVSSGSLVAAALTLNQTPRITSERLKQELGPLIRKVFPHTNELVDLLIKKYGFTLGELEAIFKEIMKSPPNLSAQSLAEADFKVIIENAIKEKFGIKSKISAKGTISEFIDKLKPYIERMVNFDQERADLLAGSIKNILGDNDLQDPKNDKFLAYASADKKPVFFGPPRLAKFVTGPYAVGQTKLYEALVASSAIPQFIKAPTNINFTFPDGNVKNIPDLKDGFFASEGRFDPSAIFYEAFSKQFPGENLLIVFVGNGAKVDRQFRGMLRQKFNFSSGISQETLAQGKKITFVAIDAKIKDDNNEDIFNLSGFYDSQDLEKYMDEAAEQAVNSKAYEWALKAISAAVK